MTETESLVETISKYLGTKVNRRQFLEAAVKTGGALAVGALLHGENRDPKQWPEPPPEHFFPAGGLELPPVGEKSLFEGCGKKLTETIGHACLLHIGGKDDGHPLAATIDKEKNAGTRNWLKYDDFARICHQYYPGSKEASSLGRIFLPDKTHIRVTQEPIGEGLIVFDDDKQSGLSFKVAKTSSGDPKLDPPIVYEVNLKDKNLKEYLAVIPILFGDTQKENGSRIVLALIRWDGKGPRLSFTNVPTGWQLTVPERKEDLFLDLTADQSQGQK